MANDPVLELQSHYSLVIDALDELRSALLSHVDQVGDVYGRVFEIPPPEKPPKAEGDGMGTLGDLDYQVLPSDNPVTDALDAWATTRRRVGQHPRYVARWVGVVVVPDELEPAVTAVNDAKDRLQAAIGALWPVSQYNGAGRVSRSREISLSLPLHTDRRLLYRHIPVYRREQPIGQVRFNWRRVDSIRQVTLGDLLRRIENRPIPAGVDMRFLEAETNRMYNAVASEVQSGEWRLVERTQKAPQVLANILDGDHKLVAAMPLSLPLVILQRDLARPVDEVLARAELSPITGEELANRQRQKRSDSREYRETEIPGVFLQR